MITLCTVYAASNSARGAADVSFLLDGESSLSHDVSAVMDTNQDTFIISYPMSVLPISIDQRRVFYRYLNTMHKSCRLIQKQSEM